MNYCWPNNFYIYTKKQMASGGELKVMGKRIVRTEVKFELAKLIVKQIVQQGSRVYRVRYGRGRESELSFSTYGGYEKAEHVIRALC